MANNVSSDLRRDVTEFLKVSYAQITNMHLSISMLMRFFPITPMLQKCLCASVLLLGQIGDATTCRQQMKLL
jgi:hypothetical protein